jgi:hypothetical protein
VVNDVEDEVGDDAASLKSSEGGMQICIVFWEMKLNEELKISFLTHKIISLNLF